MSAISSAVSSVLPSAVSSALATASATPTGSNTCPAINEIPVKDIACAIKHVGPGDDLPDDYDDMMESCCKGAEVEDFADDCGLYCLAIGQSVGELNQCLQDAGIPAGQIFCNGNNTATATATEAPRSTSDADRDDKDDSDDDDNSRDSEGAATALGPRQSVSKAALGMLTVLFVSAVAGASL